MNDIERKREPMEPELAQEVVRRLTFHFIKKSNKRSVDDTNTILAALNTSMNALEKQIPKKPIGKSQQKDVEHDALQNVGQCPHCHNNIVAYAWWKETHCWICGQALDWS